VAPTKPLIFRIDYGEMNNGEKRISKLGPEKKIKKSRKPQASSNKRLDNRCKII